MKEAKVFALLVVCCLMGAPASAADPLTCTDHDLLMTNEGITFLGDEPGDAKIGDRRVLNWRVHASSGRELGRFHVITTVLGARDGGHLITAVGSVDFPNGEIHATVNAWLPDASDEDQSSGAPVDWAITGGTGDFAHASGTLLTGPPSKDRSSLSDWVFELRMRCDR